MLPREYRHEHPAEDQPEDNRNPGRRGLSLLRHARGYGVGPLYPVEGWAAKCGPDRPSGGNRSS